MVPGPATPSCAAFFRWSGSSVSPGGWGIRASGWTRSRSSRPWDSWASTKPRASTTPTPPSLTRYGPEVHLAAAVDPIADEQAEGSECHALDGGDHLQERLARLEAELGAGLDRLVVVVGLGGEGETGLLHLARGIHEVEEVVGTTGAEHRGHPVLAIVEPGAAAAVQFDPPAVTVTLEGRPEIIDGITSEMMKVFANCLGMELSTTNPLPVSVHLPPGYEVTVQVDPDTVRIALPEME